MKERKDIVVIQYVFLQSLKEILRKTHIFKISNPETVSSLIIWNTEKSRLIQEADILEK